MPTTFTRDELRAWSRYIRDTLIPELNDGVEVALSATIVGAVQDFLRQVAPACIDMEILRYSRLHTAFKEICEMADRWPPAIALAADSLLLEWEIRIGPLEEVKADLWGPGGRLEGLVKLQDSGRSSSESCHRKSSTPPVMMKIRSKSSKSSWSVEGTNGTDFALQSGHIGFEIGE